MSDVMLLMFVVSGVSVSVKNDARTKVVFFKFLVSFLELYMMIFVEDNEYVVCVDDELNDELFLGK